MTNVVANRLNEGQGERQDILQALIDTRNAEDQDDRLTAEAIMGEITLFLIAGSETTSNTVGFCIVNLLRHPDKLARLLAELDEIELKQGEIVFEHNQVKHLTYLNAVINECMRLDTVAGGALSRITEGPYKLGNLNLEKDVS